MEKVILVSMRKKTEVIVFVLTFALTLLVLLCYSWFRIEKDRYKVTIKKVETQEGSKYQLMVDKKPFLIKGVCYNPAPIGKGFNYDFFLDANDPWKIDAPLLKELGVNAIRAYNVNKDNVKEAKQAINYLYKNYGIMTAVSHWMGFWDYPCPLYGSEEYCNNLKNEVIEIVRELKDAKGILCWILGNENNYSFGPQNVNPWTTKEIEKIQDPFEKRCVKADIYYTFINEVARDIKLADDRHPVVLGSGDPVCIEIATAICKDIDILGLVSYQGKSFKPLFRDMVKKWQKPIMFIEYGCDSFNALTKKEDQEVQAEFIAAQWQEISENSYLGDGTGNCLGGFLFEFSDEWWKNNEHYSLGWSEHDTDASWSRGAYYFDIAAEGNLNMNEEWWGIVSVSQDHEQGIDKRTPKKAYYLLKELWGEN